MTIRQVLRFCLPHGVVEVRRRLRDLRRIGVPPFRAMSIALDDQKWYGVVKTNALLFPEDVIPRLEVIVDVGANVGDWSDSILSISSPTKLVAVEPHPAAFAQLRSRLRDFKNAACIQVAVGSQSGDAVLNCTSASNCSSLLVPLETALIHYGKEMDVQSQVSVQLCTLDSITEDLGDISLLKMDVQGYEREVLAGAKNTLSRTRMILIEVNFQTHYKNDSLFAELDQLLSLHGFHLANIAGAFVSEDRALWSDALYCRD